MSMKSITKAFKSLRAETLAVASTIFTLWLLTVLMYTSEEVHISGDAIIALAVGYVVYRLIKLQQKYARMAYSDATKDPVTNIYNKRYLDDIGKREIKSCLRSQYSLSVVVFKIDDFENIQKQYGKKYADRALVTLTENIQSKTREGDVFARLKDNEFVVLCPDSTEATTAELARRIQLLTKSLVVTYAPKKSIEFTCSVAITQYSPETDREFTDMVTRAEEDLNSKENDDLVVA